MRKPPNVRLARWRDVGVPLVAIETPRTRQGGLTPDPWPGVLTGWDSPLTVPTLKAWAHNTLRLRRSDAPGPLFRVGTGEGMERQKPESITLPGFRLA